MSLDPGQVRMYVVRPVLQAIGAWSQPAEDLVMGTAAQESRLQFIRQLGGGPALGLWQMEPATHDDIWRHYLNRKSLLAINLLGAVGISKMPTAEAMTYNMRYAACMCRVHYLRKPGAIPTTLVGQAEYWKDHYNTHLGAGTVDQYVRSYRAVLGV